MFGIIGFFLSRNYRLITADITAIKVYEPGMNELISEIKAPVRLAHGKSKRRYPVTKCPYGKPKC